MGVPGRSSHGKAHGRGRGLLHAGGGRQGRGLLGAGGQPGEAAPAGARTLLPHVLELRQCEVRHSPGPDGPRPPAWLSSSDKYCASYVHTSRLVVPTYIRDAVTQDRWRGQEKSRAALWRGEIQKAPSLTINQIVVPRQTGAHTPNGVSLYARWLLLRVFGVGQRVSPLQIPTFHRTPRS